MESVSLLSQQFSSRWHCIVRMSAHTTHSSNNNIFWHYVYIASIVMEEGWCECLRFRHLAWEEMSWPDIHLQNMQLPSWLYISLHQDLSLWSFHIIHCTFVIAIVRGTFVTITGHWASSGYSPGYYHSLWLYTNVTNNKSELWPICDTINFPIRSRSQWRYIPSNDSCPHYIISLNTAPPFLSQCAHTP